MLGTLSRTARADLKSSQLTLEHFLMRSRTLSLYRKYLRATRDIPNPLARWETIQFFRDDVHRFRHETDLERIRDLLMQGHRFLKQMQGQMTLAGAASDGNDNKLRGTRQL
ncbi:Complex 1 LYR protein [Kalmanozyma brasiliensis GHG001]|uniref:LYR motif-containing protein 2 n=1 Tax=Kalmanozyma brasiliensis (strain GHG001) TaxID=1365824 RepID=V5F3S0_KALBG|nr:Complex 1 LYR protein [Kalmanozyma brasiliensis GHG001]EST10214.1 Complex 1 LYR protein [Kalmanozyma brasiliensis GHG001]